MERFKCKLLVSLSRSHFPFFLSLCDLFFLQSHLIERVKYERDALGHLTKIVKVDVLSNQSRTLYEADFRFIREVCTYSDAGIEV